MTTNTSTSKPPRVKLAAKSVRPQSAVNLVGADLAKWDCQQLRLTAFTIGWTASDPDIWKKVFGAEPSDVSLKPNLTAAGIVGDKHAMITGQNQRIDILFNPTLQQQEALGSIATFGTFTDTVKEFSTYGDRLLDRLGDCSRLAFGVVALIKVPSRAEGYRELQKYLPSVKIPTAEEASDFLFQVNRRRRVKLKGLDNRFLVNRLCKWSAFETRRVGITISGETISQGRPETLGAAVRAELDINTAPVVGASISRQKIKPLFAELRALSEELLRVGDAP